VRDIIFQLLANTLLTVSALYGRVTVPIALGYLLLYALYVFVVL
jgi:Ca2+/Na+ antiporter